MISAPIAVLYLSRKAEGIKPLQRFLQSYTAHPAGIAHDLIVIFKGYENKQDVAEARAVFASCLYTGIEVPDEGFDLGSYLIAAKQLNHPYLCCLNTFSHILDSDWLKKLHAHILLPEVGIVGATGSYESVQTSITLLQKAIYLHSHLKLHPTLRKQLGRYFSFLFSNTITASSTKIFKRLCQFLTASIHRQATVRQLEQEYIEWWNQVKTQGDIAAFCSFPPFPNPHIRSNAFMIERERFLSLKHNPFTSKIQTHLFENGHESMTQQVLQCGLKALIVDKQGVGYDIPNWPHSHTFRSGNQRNLLVADNQTASFTTAHTTTRLLYTLMSWGKDELVLPDDFPDLGIKFLRHLQ